MAVATTPKFSASDAERVAREVYGYTVIASSLPSERDQNFVLDSVVGEKFVLKIAKSDEERSVLELQNAVLMHVAKHARRLAVPRVLATRAGDEIVTVRDARGQPHLVRLMSWLDGEVLVDVQPHTDPLLKSLGAAVAELDSALQGFSHPAMHRELHWDVKYAARALVHVPLLPVGQQAIVRQFMDAWRAIDWSSLRRGMIHGDANDYNVLVMDGNVAGFLDFGDAVHSAVACDLAIALAYAMLDKQDPLAVAALMIAAYHRRFPLTSAEVDALYPLITARLCMSVCYAAYNARAKSGDTYQLVTARPAVALLQQLVVIPQETVRDAFRGACEMS